VKISFTLFFVGPVTLEAMIRQDGSNIAIEVEPSHPARIGIASVTQTRTRSNRDMATIVTKLLAREVGRLSDVAVLRGSFTSFHEAACPGRTSAEPIVLGIVQRRTSS